MIDWFSSKNEILFNPRMPAAEKEGLLKTLSLLHGLENQVCFATSGTSGKLKWVALSKAGILISAKAVNEHLYSDHRDIWLNPLPEFHVGGLGIIGRGHLSRAKVVSCHFPNAKWDPHYFYEQIAENQATLTSLVPTQVFDLVALGLKAPASLRAIVVGGGALSEKVYFNAVKLGWQLLPSYGLTECASQVATAQYGSWSEHAYPLLCPLSHVELGMNERGFLKIKSDALLSVYVECTGVYDPKVDGWFVTEDKAVLDKGWIKSINRGEHYVKIGGESVDLLRLEKILDEEKFALKFQGDAVLATVDDDRLGFRIHLAVASEIDESVKNLMDHYHKRVFPFERIAKVSCVKEIPRSPLNKVLKAELNEILKR